MYEFFSYHAVVLASLHREPLQQAVNGLVQRPMNRRTKKPPRSISHSYRYSPEQKDLNLSKGSAPPHGRRKTIIDFSLTSCSSSSMVYSTAVLYVELVHDSQVTGFLVERKIPEKRNAPSFVDYSTVQYSIV